MRKVSRALVTAVITSVMLTGASGVAQATESSPTPFKTGTADAPISITADGNFYALVYYYNIIVDGFFNAGNDDRWPDGVRNRADWVRNNGYPGGRDHVNIYWGSYYTGAYACIGPGTSWDLREGWQRFNWVLDGDYRGYWELVRDNAASHRWVHYCGNNTW